MNGSQEAEAVATINTSQHGLISVNQTETCSSAPDVSQFNIRTVAFANPSSRRRITNSDLREVHAKTHARKLMIQLFFGLADFFSQIRF